MRILFFIAVLAFFGLTALGQEKAPTKKQAFENEFRIGIFWPPVWEHTNQAQYKIIKDAHINYIQNVLGSQLDTEERNRKMLELAEKNGLKLFVADPRVNGSSDDIKAMVECYRKYPAMSGYYVVDEPDVKGMDGAAKKYQTILSLDRQAVPYVNLLPSWAVPDYDNYVNQWIEKCGKENLKYLSFDCYPFLVDGTLRNTYYQNLDVIRKAGLKIGVPTSCYLQSVGIPGAYRRPSEADMRLNVYSCLAYGIKNLVWFTYWTPTGRGEKFTNAVIDSCGKKTDLYVPFQKLNLRISQLGKTLINLDALSVFHVGKEVAAGMEALPSDYVLQPESHNAELLLADFKEKTAHKQFVMVVNKSVQQPVSLPFHLKSGKQIREVAPASNGSKKSRYDKRSQKLYVDLLPGEGKLFEIY